MQDYLQSGSDQQVSDIHLERLSRTCCRKWRNLTSHLKLDRIVMDDIDRRSVKEGEKRLDFFTEWKEQKGSAATYKALIKALLNIGCRNDAEHVYKLSQSPGGSPSTTPAQTPPGVATAAEGLQLLSCSQCFW